MFRIEYRIGDGEWEAGDFGIFDSIESAESRIIHQMEQNEILMGPCPHIHYRILLDTIYTPNGTPDPEAELAKTNPWHGP